MKNEFLKDFKDMVEYYDAKNSHEKHLKGYIFDSLVYRYQLALYKALSKDAEDIMLAYDFSKRDAEAQARRNYDRNLKRFMEILNEAIGEHD